MNKIPQKWVVAAVFVVGLFMDIMDTTIVNVALPTLAREFGVNAASIEWVVLGYMLSLAVWIPASGWIGDRIGTKKTFLFALAMFTLASALCGASGNLIFLPFDGMGQWRDTENGGLAIDSSGSYTFADGTTKSWTDAAGLMQILAAIPQTHTCFAKKIAAYGLQRYVTPSDMPLLTAMTSAGMTSGTSSEKQLIIQLGRSDAFRTHGGP